MISRNQKFKTFISAGLDFLTVFFSYLLSNYIRFNWLDGKADNIYRSGFYSVEISALLSLIVVIILYALKTYKIDRTYDLGRMFIRVIISTVTGSMFLTTLFYASYIFHVSRMTILINFFLSSFVLILKRIVMVARRKYLHNNGLGLAHVVIAGGGPLAEKYVREIKARPYMGIWIDGYVADKENPNIDCRYLGGFDKLENCLMSEKNYEAIIALEAADIERMSDVIDVCDKCGTRFSVVPIYNDYLPHHPTVDHIGSCKLINVRETPFDYLGNAIIKRAFDILGSLILIIITSPVLLICAIGVKLSSPGPVIFKQERVGLNKKHFNMYKFRSMRINVESSTAWSTNEDPRKTKFGSFIRKYSLDELPQFFNVLKGDMSLVGPRPEIPFHVSHFKDEIPLYLVRQQVRPGCTGWAQIHGLRGDTDIKERIEYDIWYIEHWSFWLDVRIIFETVFGGKMINSERIIK